MVSAVQRRIVRIAEQAFWDSKVEALASNDTAVAAGASRELASLLASLGADLLAVLPAQVGPTATEQLLLAFLYATQSLQSR